jgi:intracellular multiplication protein IcmO
MAEKRKIRAVNVSHEKDQSELIRDVRPLTQMIFDSFHSGVVSGSLISFAAVVPFIEPLLALPSLAAGVIVYWKRASFAKKESLPFRVPSVAGKKDFSDPLPGGRGFDTGKGIFYLGQDDDGKELWLKSGDLLTHMLVLGTTGSGKTVTLTSLASNYLAMGGGFIFTDPKAAPMLWRNLQLMARMFGRDDDFRLVNYMTANAPTKKDGPERLTNTVNPFAFGNADQLTQLLISLIEVSSGDNAVFGQNAMMLVSALMLALVEKRDTGVMELSITTIRDWMTSERMVVLAKDKNLRTTTSDSVKSFLKTVGWEESKEFDKQGRAFGEQFQYAKGYFGLALNMLNDTYGHIYRHSAGEVDMFDIIKNRRIVLNMLPSLEKSPGELKQIGKITLSGVRNAISAGLGGGAEGKVDDVTGSLPLDSPLPFGVITDEYAAIPTPGFADILTQGRGIGISATVGSQDLAGMQGETASDKKGAEQILENTKIKLGFTLAGAGETWGLYKGLADEMNVMQTQGFGVGSGGSGKQGAMDFSYRDQQSANVTKVSRINLLDLQEQTEGQFHAFFKGKIIRGSMFFDLAFDKPNSNDDAPLKEYNLKIVRLSYIVPANKDELESRIGAIRGIVKQVIGRARSNDYPEFTDMSAEFGLINKTLTDLKNRNASAEMMATTAFIQWSKDKGSEAGGQALKAMVKEQAKQAQSNKDEAEDGTVLSYTPLDEQNDTDNNEPSIVSSLLPVFGASDDNLNDELSHQSALKAPDEHPTKEMLGDEEALVVNEIAQAEQAAGIEPEKSTARAQGTINRVKAGTAYPTTPQPVSDENTVMQVDSTIDNILGI